MKRTRKCLKEERYGKRDVVEGARKGENEGGETQSERPGVCDLGAFARVRGDVGFHVRGR